MRGEGSIPRPLLQAYRAAEVHIRQGGRWIPWEAFPRAPDTRIHILTAQNPGSVPLPIQENQARQLRLQELLGARGYLFLPARNRAPDGGWEEAAFALLDAPREAVLELGRSFGQLAVYEIGEEGRRVLPCGGEGGRTAGKDGEHPPP